MAAATGSSVLWVPAHIHPELNPNEFQRWLNENNQTQPAPESPTLATSPSAPFVLAAGPLPTESAARWGVRRKTINRSLSYAESKRVIRGDGEVEDILDPVAASAEHERRQSISNGSAGSGSTTLQRSQSGSNGHSGVQLSRKISGSSQHSTHASQPVNLTRSSSSASASAGPGYTPNQRPSSPSVGPPSSASLSGSFLPPSMISSFYPPSTGSASQFSPPTSPTPGSAPIYTINGPLQSSPPVRRESTASTYSEDFADDGSGGVTLRRRQGLVRKRNGNSIRGLPQVPEKAELPEPPADGAHPMSRAESPDRVRLPLSDVDANLRALRLVSEQLSGSHNHTHTHHGSGAPQTGSVHIGASEFGDLSQMEPRKMSSAPASSPSTPTQLSPPALPTSENDAPPPTPPPRSVVTKQFKVGSGRGRGSRPLPTPTPTEEQFHSPSHSPPPVVDIDLFPFAVVSPHDIGIDDDARAAPTPRSQDSGAHSTDKPPRVGSVSSDNKSNSTLTSIDLQVSRFSDLDQILAGFGKDIGSATPVAALESFAVASAAKDKEREAERDRARQRQKELDAEEWAARERRVEEEPRSRQRQPESERDLEMEHLRGAAQHITRSRDDGMSGGVEIGSTRDSAVSLAGPGQQHAQQYQETIYHNHFESSTAPPPRIHSAMQNSVSSSDFAQQRKGVQDREPDYLHEQQREASYRRDMVNQRAEYRNAEERAERPLSRTPSDSSRKKRSKMGFFGKLFGKDKDSDADLEPPSHSNDRRRDSQGERVLSGVPPSVVSRLLDASGIAKRKSQELAPALDRKASKDSLPHVNGNVPRDFMTSPPPQNVNGHRDQRYDGSYDMQLDMPTDGSMQSSYAPSFGQANAFPTTDEKPLSPSSPVMPTSPTQNGNFGVPQGAVNPVRDASLGMDWSAARNAEPMRIDPAGPNYGGPMNSSQIMDADDEPIIPVSAQRATSPTYSTSSKSSTGGKRSLFSAIANVFKGKKSQPDNTPSPEAPPQPAQTLPPPPWHPPIPAPYLPHLYRLSHFKLAHQRRVLREQVLVSNLMLRYIATVGVEGLEGWEGMAVEGGKRKKGGKRRRRRNGKGMPREMDAMNMAGGYNGQMGFAPAGGAGPEGYGWGGANGAPGSGDGWALDAAAGAPDMGMYGRAGGWQMGGQYGVPPDFRPGAGAGSEEEESGSSETDSDSDGEEMSMGSPGARNNAGQQMQMMHGHGGGGMMGGQQGMMVGQQGMVQGGGGMDDQGGYGRGGMGQGARRGMDPGGGWGRGGY
ncbi:hypothetical protein M427DRAFT_152544 [Gonapodya prolifera JEL478]|uniref:Protein Zds1 C-terminal domain-containing protein n=1 Tax=Gonapodya prolifera (strain JEL478) TaxID=1344416 RepID=A0A139AS57_GONPJ|nr:hypothetical protein M427DRAFT_152544 [Gonapodya prolifera JEL478]|eukprot:KXS19572.1 hypothetical protein M427DRAFT_152544 [Gonapodya prolifera JEL478]